MVEPNAGRSKVARVLDEHDLSIDLAARWTGEAGDRLSLRELARLLNERLLQAAMQRAGGTPLDGEVANTYRLLTSDDVSSGARRQAERTLEKDGVDVDAVRRDFVSHRAVHSYLRDHLGVEPPSAGAESGVSAKAETLTRLAMRTKQVTQDSLERLRDADDLAAVDFEVLVDVHVFCEGCGRSTELTTFLERGGCRCQLD